MTRARRAAMMFLAAVLAITMGSATAAAPFGVPLANPADTAGSIGLYVAIDGNDANSGSLSRPLRTLQRAARLVTPGTTVYIRSGTYDGFTLTRSGMAGAPIVFRSYPGERAVISGASGRTNVIALEGVHHVRISRLTVQGGQVRKGAGILVRDSHHVTIDHATLRRNHSFGALIEDSRQVAVRHSAISRNATGVRVRYGGKGVVIEHNRIFSNDRMTVNDPEPGNDTGGQGIAFEKTSGGAVARHNRIWGNRADSHDYGEDGVAIEIFGSSNLRITRNRMWNNRAVLETGTNSLYECANNRITWNVAWSSTSKTAAGMNLRCAKNGLVAHNTFDNLTWWAMQLSHQSGSFGASVGGLRVVNNIVHNIKSFHINTSLPDSVVLDHNLVWAPDKHVAYVAGRGFTKSLAEFRQWTGHEKHGISGAPRFADSSRSYRLSASSPAIDRGLEGVTNVPFRGSAPDLGWREYKP